MYKSYLKIVLLIPLKKGKSPDEIFRGYKRNILTRMLFLFPYKLQMMPTLKENHYQTRLSLAQYCQNKPEGFREYLIKHFLSDKCIFRFNMYCYEQNAHILGEILDL